MGTLKGLAVATGKTQFVFFDHYIYQASVKMTPVEFKPFIATLNFKLTDPEDISLKGEMSLKFGTLATTIQQFNRKYKGSLLDPLFDDTAKFEDYTDDFDYDGNNYYVKNVLLDAPNTVGLWQWSPPNGFDFGKTFFTWDIRGTEF